MPKSLSPWPLVAIEALQNAKRRRITTLRTLEDVRLP